MQVYISAWFLNINLRVILLDNSTKRQVLGDHVLIHLHTKAILDNTYLRYLRLTNHTTFRNFNTERTLQLRLSQKLNVWRPCIYLTTYKLFQTHYVINRLADLQRSQQRCSLLGDNIYHTGTMHFKRDSFSLDDRVTPTLVFHTRLGSLYLQNFTHEHFQASCY